MPALTPTIVAASIFLNTFTNLYAQPRDTTCKVLMSTIAGSYSGGCQKGLANGEGDSKGLHQYTGNFKNGLPNGKGSYHYSSIQYYTGNFQDGLKEGKGEMHYIKDSLSDSTIKGYWSADEFRGKTYVTYLLDGGYKMDRFDIRPSSQSGTSVTFKIITTGNTTNTEDASVNNTIKLYSVISLDKERLVKISSHTATPDHDMLTIEVSSFPIKLKGMLSNGVEFNLDLYKSADWNVQFYCHR